MTTFKSILKNPLGMFSVGDYGIYPKMPEGTVSSEIPEDIAQLWLSHIALKMELNKGIYCVDEGESYLKMIYLHDDIYYLWLVPYEEGNT
jgi:hypothetical protein